MRKHTQITAFTPTVLHDSCSQNAVTAPLRAAPVMSSISCPDQLLGDMKVNIQYNNIKKNGQHFLYL